MRDMFCRKAVNFLGKGVVSSFFPHEEELFDCGFIFVP